EHHELPEIQSLDVRAIVEAKLDAAIAKGLRSVFVEDTSLSIRGLKGLPGPFIRWFLETNGTIGIAQMALNSGEPEAEAKSVVGAVLPNGERVFAEGVTHGKIVSPRGREFGWNSIFEPLGSPKTFGEMSDDERALNSMRTIAFRNLQASLETR
ncbi:MAG: non-canonical purine NTP pyrophosphatase, partial [Deltaproteobacteria bacterium]|nr:non-canonical purine NTP pyrophosphatase [Deltaproteobacteria bacterium]